ncbi:cytochrome c1 [Telmatospirillum sp. J64-1]|uniref:cytochrome c1 n=1 Tax=Telmatospirillum sp. J64-1 TaxID=2502183 RepID=UPI00115E86E7|nr:cytochrome c1 [Telmatospirillum sp. J64-1]
MRKFFKIAMVAAGLTAAAAGSAHAAGEEIHYESQNWSWNGIFGHYDRAQLQRGLHIYREVCGNCHALSLVAFRNLEAIGLDEDSVRALAAEYQVVDGPNDEGEMFEREGRPSDRFVKPFPNEQAARAANNGAYPPDLSLITKARVNGPNYLYALMTGYQDEPEGVELMPGMNYNVAFPGHQIAMPPQLFDDMVSYADGTPATVDQMARDITAFLNWAAEPELEQRKSLGVKVMLFLAVLTAMLYALKRRIWSDVH